MEINEANLRDYDDLVEEKPDEEYTFMYLHYILSQEENELLYKYFKVQSENPAKNYWYLSIMEDLKEFEIDLTFEEIKDFKKNTRERRDHKQKAEHLINGGPDFCFLAITGHHEMWFGRTQVETKLNCLQDLFKTSGALKNRRKSNC